MTEYSQSALNILRNPQLTMKWYVVPIFLVVLYVYYKEIREKHFNVVLGAIALWGMDLFNEIWNSIVFHATSFAPVWGTPNGAGDTALLLLIGYNIEISMMFALLGITACLILPEDKKKRILGVNNRVFFIVLFTTVAVLIECFLNYSGLLTWEYSWWSVKSPWLIWLIGYAPFFTVSYIVHDMKTRRNQLLTVGGILLFDAVLLSVFGSMGWM